MSPTGNSAPPRDMDRHLGDGGMALVGRLGATFTAAGAGRSTGAWRPTDLACNPRGAVQGGVFTVILDAAMSLALHSVLPPDEAAVSIDLRSSQPLPAERHTHLHVSGEVIRLGGTVVFVAATVTRADGETVAFGTGTFIRRPKQRQGEPRCERNGAA
jgi:acyl-coenzyme A thioesterase PaaI-like protein